MRVCSRARPKSRRWTGVAPSWRDSSKARNAHSSRPRANARRGKPRSRRRARRSGGRKRRGTTRRSSSSSSHRRRSATGNAALSCKPNRPNSPPKPNGGEFGLFGLQLSAAFPVALLRLCELELLDLRVVPRLFLPPDLLARLLERGFPRRAFALGLLECALRAFELSRQLGATPVQRLDFGLAREQTRIGGIRRVETHGVARELIAFPVHQHRTGRQCRARAGVRATLDDIHPGEPVRQRAA